MIDDTKLPASFTTGKRSLSLPSSDLKAFLENDLSVHRIERIYKHLWLVGRPYPPRALNIQLVLDRALVPTTDASLHLVWTTKKVFLKPLPRYMVSDSFYSEYLTPQHPYGPALGLIRSYLSLLPSELDFTLARKAHLLPDDFTWDEWRDLTKRILKDYPGVTIFNHVPGRYQYGELRLSRLDKIYRFTCEGVLHGYSPLTGVNSYQEFFSENHVVIAAWVVYIIVVLTAMQVGLTLEELASNKTFMKACYGFTVFAIISPIAAVGTVAGIFLILFLTNWWRTSAVQRAQRRHSGKLHV